MAKRNSVALIRSPEDVGTIVLHNLQRGMEAWARLLGWHPITQIVLEDRSYFIGEDGELSATLKTLGPNDRAITPSLDHIAASPRAFREGLPKVLGSGTELFVADLGGPIGPHLPGLMRGWQDAEQIERELADERAERREQAKKFQKLFEDFTTDFAAQWVKANGVPARGLVMPSWPHEVIDAFPVELPAEPVEGANDFAIVGAVIRARREMAGLTQADLAAELGVNPSAVSRLESSGLGPQREPALAIVAPDVLPSDEIKALVGPNVETVLLFNARRALLGAEEARAVG